MLKSRSIIDCLNRGRPSQTPNSKLTPGHDITSIPRCEILVVSGMYLQTLVFFWSFVVQGIQYLPNEIRWLPAGEPPFSGVGINGTISALQVLYQIGGEGVLLKYLTYLVRIDDKNKNWKIWTQGMINDTWYDTPLCNRSHRRQSLAYYSRFSRFSRFWSHSWTGSGILF